MLLPLATKIEEFKQLGVSHVQLHWGDDLGLDQNVPMQERRVKLTGVPSEFYGKVKLLWAGRLVDLLQADFSKMPETLTVPLDTADILRAETEGGWFAFGEAETLTNLCNRYRT